MIYHNAETEKSNIFSNNKNKAGIYLWTHLESGKKYVGSAVDLSRRLSYYYSLSALKRRDNYISRAIINYGYSSFSLTILEYIDIFNLSKDSAKTLILEREQYYLDTLEPEYNILNSAGNNLGYKHSEDTLIKMSGENHYMFGKNHSLESLVKMSLVKKGENNPMYGKIHSTESLALMSLAKKGKTHSPETKSLMRKPRTEDTKVKMSTAKGEGTIYVYNADKTTLINTFPSARKTAEFLILDILLF